MAKQASREIRIKSAKIAIGADESISQVARRLGVDPKQLQRWVRKFKADGEAGFVGRGRHKTSNDYQELASNMGFEWVGTELGYANQNTQWRCSKGHTWQAPYSRIAQKHGCPVCRYSQQGRTQSLSDEQYHELAEERGFAWIGPAVGKTAIRTSWQCISGHVWEARYSNVRKGSGCPYCAGLAKKTPDDYLDLARVRGFIWLGPIVNSSNTKTRWQCSVGHSWWSTFQKLQRGSGCPHCASKVPLTKSNYASLAESRGFIWLGPEVANKDQRTNWQCQEGHTWATSYGSIRGGSGCPFCAGKAPRTESDYRSIAHEQGIVWLGPMVSNVNLRTYWRCENGHEFQRNFNNMMYSTGCPECLDFINGVRVSKNQRTIADMLDGELNKKEGSYYIDIYVERKRCRIAIEYDSWFWHAGNQDYDDKRDKDLIAEGYKVLRIRSNKQLPSQKQIDSAIRELVSTADRKEIVLPDWGVGRIRRDIGA